MADRGFRKTTFKLGSISDTPYIGYHRTLDWRLNCDRSQLVVEHRAVGVGEVADVLLAYEGLVVVDYVLPERGMSRIVAKVTPGFATAVTMDPIISKEMTIEVRDDHGRPVTRAEVVMSEKASISDDDTGSKISPAPRSLAVANESSTARVLRFNTGADGRATFRIMKCRRLLFAVSREGIVDKSELLWSGHELPEQSGFVVLVQRAGRMQVLS
jgi:hypothetical protein